MWWYGLQANAFLRCPLESRIMTFRLAQAILQMTLVRVAASSGNYRKGDLCVLVAFLGEAVERVCQH